MSWEIPPEGDRELELPVRLVADGHHPRVGLADPAAVVLLLAHVVDDVPEHGYTLYCIQSRFQSPQLCNVEK